MWNLSFLTWMDILLTWFVLLKLGGILIAKAVGKGVTSIRQWQRHTVHPQHPSFTYYAEVFYGTASRVVLYVTICLWGWYHICLPKPLQGYTGVAGFEGDKCGITQKLEKAIYHICLVKGRQMWYHHKRWYHINLSPSTHAYPIDTARVLGNKSGITQKGMF